MTSRETLNGIAEIIARPWRETGETYQPMPDWLAARMAEALPLLERLEADAERRGMERAAGIVDAEHDAFSRTVTHAHEHGHRTIFVQAMQMKDELERIAAAIRAEAGKGDAK